MRLQWNACALGLLLCATALATSAQTNLTLSEKEQQWVADHSPVRVGITPEWAPFSYLLPNGKAAGIDIDILGLITQRTGLKFDIVAMESWNETLRLVTEKRIDFTTSTARTSEREAIFFFTRQYYESPVVIISREGDLRFYHLSLLRRATLAMPRKHVTTMAIMQRLPDARIVLTDTALDSFLLVAGGRADATVANMMISTRYLNDHPELKLSICGVTDFNFPLRLAIRRDLPVLATILDKALASITREELDDISGRHLMFGLQAVRRGAVWRKRWGEILGVSVVAVGLLLWWNYSVRKEVRARRRVEAELRDINKSLEMFSFSISHDLRSPLRVIRGLAIALQEDYEGKLDLTANDYLQRINTAALRMDNLICDVLAYSQASRSQLPMQPVSLDLLVRQVVAEYPREQQECFHVDPHLPNVSGNQALLSQCISNLLANAVKFSKPGQLPEVRVRAETDDANVKLWVEDNGIGIAPEDQQRIFNIFERVSTARYEGSGIGLAVVAKAVEKMGGKVGVLSELGKGSRFWIELPLATAERSDDLRKAQRVDLRSSPKPRLASTS